MQVLHPDNKIQYLNNARVEVALEGNPAHIVRGKIVGLASSHLIDHWIVQLDENIPGWEYSCASVQHTFIKPEGDNRPFLCEGVSRV